MSTRMRESQEMFLRQERKAVMDKEEKRKKTTDEGDFEGFRQIVAALRAKDGCPWDKAQTFESLKPCMVNEMTEAIAGIEIWKKTGDAENLCEELGDVLLQVVLLSQIAQEEGLFCIEDVITGISSKMIRRHPHVFGKKTDDVQAGEVPGRWEEIKKREKKDRTPRQEQMYKEAFCDAAKWTIRHLQEGENA